MFEYKYVEKLNDGSVPFHKKFLDSLKKKHYIKAILYCVGVFLVLMPILLLLWDTSCVDKEPIDDLNFRDYNFCWSTLGSAFYNVLC